MVISMTESINSLRYKMLKIRKMRVSTSTIVKDGPVYRMTVYWTAWSKKGRRSLGQQPAVMRAKDGHIYPQRRYS